MNNIEILENWNSLEYKERLQWWEDNAVDFSNFLVCPYIQFDGKNITLERKKPLIDNYENKIISLVPDGLTARLLWNWYKTIKINYDYPLYEFNHGFSDFELCTEYIEIMTVKVNDNIRKNHLRVKIENLEFQLKNHEFLNLNGLKINLTQLAKSLLYEDYPKELTILLSLDDYIENLETLYRIFLLHLNLHCYKELESISQISENKEPENIKKLTRKQLILLFNSYFDAYSVDLNNVEKSKFMSLVSGYSPKALRILLSDKIYSDNYPEDNEIVIAELMKIGENPFLEKIIKKLKR